MFRINPLNALRLLSENVYHEIFKDASTEITTDELELAKKIKGKTLNNIPLDSAEPINQSTEDLYHISSRYQSKTADSLFLPGFW